MPKIPLVDVDIDGFFELGELAQIAEDEDGNEFPIISRSGYINVESGIVGIDNDSPYCLAKISDAGHLEHGSEIEVEGVRFMITQVRPADSELYTKLYLQYL